MASNQIRIQDLLENPDPRVPVCLCLDTSGSMLETQNGTPTGKYLVRDGIRYEIANGGTTRMDVMRKGLQQLYDTIYQNEDSRYAAEIAVVTFDDTARVLSDFSRVEYNDVREKIPELRAGNSTAMGQGINLALDLLEKRKEQYKQKGVDYFQPWLILMTDGVNQGSEQELQRARQRIQKMVREKTLSVYPFMLGDSEGMATLESLSPEQQPMRIGLTQMEGMFRWLGKSVNVVSSGSIQNEGRIDLSAVEVTRWDRPLEG